MTDAAVVLGMLPVDLAGGVGLSRDRAEAALAPLAARLGFESAADVARGTLHIAAAAMADAIRGITVEQGRDPREAALVAFGGAGPLFGTLVADELDVDTVVIPALAGNFSAWGLLGADLAQTASRTRLVRLGDGAVAEVDALADELFAELESRTAREGLLREVHLDVRYVGQEHTLTITAPSAEGRVTADAAGLGALFEREYARTFGHSMDEEHEIVTVRALVRLPRELRPAPRPAERRAARAAHTDGLVVRPRRARPVRARRPRHAASGRHPRGARDRDRDDRDDVPRRRLRRRACTRAAPCSPGGNDA